MCHSESSKAHFPCTSWDVYLCDRDFCNPICSIHTQAELISTPNILQTNFKSVDNKRCWVCTVFGKDKVWVWLKYTETTSTVQKTSDCTLPVGDSPEKKIILSKWLPGTDWDEMEKWQESYSSGGKTVLQGLTVKFGLYCEIWPVL